ncbi:hypothetical protein [Lacimicrobium alkaliphilum]|uniref:Sulfotransferase domain-containing protein n=1 Tax=Lacimicrobium alkaliphilum TaxID=1526571 RepID=A0A0U2ZJQ2_9ALTE|nr:hypothetical protein [Lacimicrobium alkaliphilum]ALS99239.1 hypothetical protein AT746_13895 [Lacimicrobium alkaliphilum]
MKLILHIGTHKTGTTAIQQFLLANEKALYQSGTLYPVSCLGQSKNQYSYLATLLRHGKLTKVKRDLKLIREEALAKRCQTVILSGEEFSTLNYQHVAELCDLLGDFDVEVKIYFRNAYDFVISAFSEINKTSRSLTKIEKLNKRLSRLVDYDRTLNSWCKVFGDEAVDVYSYDRIKHECIPHFLRSVDIDENLIRELTANEMMNAYSGVNSRFDPIASFLLVFFGKIRDSRDYDVAKETCGKIFSDKNSSDQLLRFLAHKYLKAKDVKYSHHKLLPLIEDILPEESIDLEQAHALLESREYMMELGRFLIAMGTRETNRPWWSRFLK